MHAIRIFFLVAVLIASAAVAFARQSPPLMLADRRGEVTALDDGATTGRGGKLDEKKREDVMKKIETVRIWRLTEELKLDQATAAKLSAFLSTFDQQRKSILREQVTITKDLRRMLNTPKPDESKLKSALERLEKNHYAAQELKEKEFSGLKEILSTEQQARFVLFQEKFRHEIRKMLGEARTGGQGRSESR